MIQVKPCLLQWNDLPDRDQSKFCSECSKAIPDLTHLSNNEIVELHKKKNGKLCGKISYSQIDRINPYSSLNKFIIALLIVFGTGLFTLSAQAQDTLNNVKFDIQSKNELSFISGSLVDENQEPLPFCNIWLEENGNKIGTSSDFDGKYKLNFQWGNKQSIQLFYEFYGFETKSIIINRTNTNNIVLNTIVLKEIETVLMGMLIIEQPNSSHQPDDLRKTTFGRQDIQRHPKK